jgi:hypothetical protein
MPEDDFLIPRLSYSGAAEAETNPPLNEAAQGVQIDPRTLEERLRRKRALAPQPRTVDNDDCPWRNLDRRIGDAFPAFEERMWTLGETARWVTERTREAVNGLSIDDERLLEIVVEIQGALAGGEVRAWAHTPTDPVPRELPTETWAIYQLAIEERHGLLWIIPVHSTGSPNDAPVFLDLRLSREGVLRRWPDDQERAPSPGLGTVGAEHGCRIWLANLIKAKPHNPQPKHALRKEAKGRFPTLSDRGFDRAWTAAISETGAVHWSAPGRRS